MEAGLKFHYNFQSCLCHPAIFIFAYSRLYGTSYLYGSIHDPQRSGAWEGKSLRGCVLPFRTILSPQLFINGFEAAVKLLTLTKPRCPHMRCVLNGIFRSIAGTAPVTGHGSPEMGACWTILQPGT